jgi:hypothetical protein
MGYWPPCWGIMPVGWAMIIPPGGATMVVPARKQQPNVSAR